MSLVKIIKRYQIQIDAVLDKMPTTDKIHDNQQSLTISNLVVNSVFARTFEGLKKFTG